jgi:formate transporter
MDYIKPVDVAKTMLEVGRAKAMLSPRDLLIRGALSGAILGTATSFAFTAAVTTGQPIVGALIFPVGLVMIVVLGLELVTGSFALVPLPYLEGRSSFGSVIGNWSWVFLGNLIGSLVYGILLAIALTNFWHTEATGVAARIIATAEAKTTGYAALGAAGMTVAFVKAMLCNWLVCLGVVMGMTSTSTVGKIVGAWLPISVFFAQGFEHTVVNMFIIPTGMFMGAKVTVSDWWIWNVIPVTLGNLAGGFTFTGLAIYATYRSAPTSVPLPDAMAAKVPAE